MKVHDRWFWGISVTIHYPFDNSEWPTKALIQPLMYVKDCYFKEVLTSSKTWLACVFLYTLVHFSFTLSVLHSWFVLNGKHDMNHISFWMEDSLLWNFFDGLKSICISSFLLLLLFLDLLSYYLSAQVICSP